MKQKTLYLIIGLLVLAVVMMSGCIEEKTPSEVPKETPQQVIESKIVIKDYNIEIDHAGVDKLYLDEVNVMLRNEGSAPVKIDKIVLSLGKSKIEDTLVGSLNPGEEKEYSLPTYPPLEKEIGIEQAKGIISTIDSSGKILTEKNITIRIPIARIGATIPEVGGKHNLSLTLLSWKESNIAVNGPYGVFEEEYYTFTAKPGMKFIILTFKFQNNGIRPQETPYLDEGEIATDKGYIYPMWKPVGGISAEEYKPRKATDEEVKTLIGDSGGFEELLPEESTVGCVVFEIPKDGTPIEVSIIYVPSIIKYGEGPK